MIKEEKHEQLQEYISRLEKNKKFIKYFNSKLKPESDDYAGLKIIDQDFNEIELCFRCSEFIGKSKYNNDHIIWHKGIIAYFIRHDDLNKRRYVNYSEIVINDYTIEKSLEDGDFLYCLFVSEV